MQAELFDSTRHDPREAPAGYYAILKAEAKPKDSSNICRACDWRHECQRPDTDFSTPGHRCMAWARNDASSVLFRRAVPNAEITGRTLAQNEADGA